MRKENVILPSATIAEIVSVKDIELAENKPAWYLGEMQWRGEAVPLISFEAAGGEDIANVNLNTQAVVLHVVADDDMAASYVGLVMSGVPHVTHFNRKQIVTDEEMIADHPMVAQKVRINGARVSVLDLDEIASMVAENAPQLSA